ncbi:hypothetical protein SCHPADRAFT_687091 [Schizopora paradoxa]|uniref:Uncharacterized protein n=1 Tax=Schizopora paradoxa TaxID=27342 RepID=A0A0H2RP08_9AGAM|nr:hypothetical protein SCHPADRAFT_687091 [Schizopora paradoxa]
MLDPSAVNLEPVAEIFDAARGRWALTSSHPANFLPSVLFQILLVSLMPVVMAGGTFSDARQLGIYLKTITFGATKHPASDWRTSISLTLTLVLRTRWNCDGASVDDFVRIVTQAYFTSLGRRRYSVEDLFAVG